MQTLDWGEMAELTISSYSQFSSESWNERVKELYKEIVLDPEMENDSIRSSFLQATEKLPIIRSKFTEWLLEQRATKSNGAFTYKEVLQFINHLSFLEEERYRRGILNK